MNLEFSLRQRALRSQLIAWGFILLAAGALMLSFLLMADVYAETASVAARVRGSATDSMLSPQALALVTCILGYSGILTAAWFLVRFANVERRIAVHCSSIADALCICGESISDLEKAAVIMLPPAVGTDVSETDRSKELAALSDLVKALR